MESPFIAQSTKRTVSKKALLVAALAFVAVVGVLCVYNADAIELRIFNGVGNSVLVYRHWKRTHSKMYGLVEDVQRYTTFKQNYYLIEKHNKLNSSYKLGLNQFADLTNKEYAALYTGAKAPIGGAENCPPPSHTNAIVPDTLDWRTQGRVGPVKNQQQCGSCWAFSTTVSLEGLSAKNGKLGSFSEQQLVDCSGSYGNYGCGGGWVQAAYHYVLDHGIAAESDYTYTATDGQCKDSTVTPAFKMTDCANVDVNSVDALKQALQTGPVSVYIEADTSAFQLYTSGVIDDSANCYPEGMIDHAVLAVGYDSEAWIVKNSWDTTWGDSGYVRIGLTSSDARGICGILSCPNTYPL